MKLFYTIGINLYSAFVHFASLWNAKAKKWVNGRKDSWKKIEEFCRLISSDSSKNTYWFHCASLGEFEQGRPLIEAIKKRETCYVVVSFFSPSGYEIRKNYELADLVIYLPSDSKKNASRFYKLIQPNQVFFVKYEFWANYIFEAKKLNIPLYSIAAVFRKNQIFFKFYGGYMRQVLTAITKIFVQDMSSQVLLRSINIDAVVSGDTRYDRVMNNSKNALKFELISDFCGNNKVMVLGSVWAEDLTTISNVICNLSSDWKVIIAPHEIDEAHLREAESFFQAKKLIRYSKLESGADCDLLLIDNVGMLMHLYGYANIAYVGGAFKTGLHNILEPASFGLPVIFGPYHSKFPEAQLFIDNGIGFSIKDATEFSKIFTTISASNLKNKVEDFMNTKTGAAQVILNGVN